jgi:hypothetical protein
MNAPTVQPGCETGTSWDGAACVAPAPPPAAKEEPPIDPDACAKTAFDTSLAETARKEAALKAMDVFARAGTKEIVAKLERVVLDLHPTADEAAHAKYAVIDAELRSRYDPETGRHDYTGLSEEQILGKYDQNGAQVAAGAYQRNAQDAMKYEEALEPIVRLSPSGEWAAVAMARQGTLFDSLRSGLANAVPPVTPASPKPLFVQLKNVGQPSLMDQADELRKQVKQGWRGKRDVELAATNELMIRRYASAVALAKRLRTTDPAIVHAKDRLRQLTTELGEEKMRQYVESVMDPTDPSGTTRLRYRSGMYAN